MAYPPLEDAPYTEEIEGAPPAETPAEARARQLRETLTINRYLYQRSQQVEQLLLAASDLSAVLEVLLSSFPRHLGFGATELWLHDPEGVLAGLLPGSQRYGHHLALHRDVFTIQELYALEPVVERIDASDPRMFEILRSEEGVEQALLLPLVDGGRIIGSLHCGMTEPPFALGEVEREHLGHLAAFVSLCFRNALDRQQVSRLTMIDPLTQISNLRGFEKDIAREIARSSRAEQPLSVLMLEIDEYDELHGHYGDVTGQFLVKKVSERISSGLRTTDYLARLSGSRLAVLVPGSSEVLAGDIAERIRADIEAFAIDDGHGANLQVTLSIGYVCWAPQHFPAVDMVQLARQMETAAVKALSSARDAGGNCAIVGRLTALLV